VNKLLFFFVFIFSSPLFAQKDSLSRFQIGVSLMPEMDLMDFDKNFNYKPIINHNIGINLNYSLSKTFLIETGIQYYNSRGKYENQVINMGEPYHLKGRFSSKSVRTPLKINMLWGKGKTKLITSAGVFLHFKYHSHSETYYIYSDRTEFKITRQPINTFRDLFGSPMLSIGMDYRFNNKINIRIEPTLWRPDLDVSSFLMDYVFGVNFAAYYRL
jgi:hypothetical protein